MKMGWVGDVARMKEMPTNYGRKFIGARPLGNHIFTLILCFLLQREREREREREK
jgi:hypothetical protein